MDAATICRNNKWTTGTVLRGIEYFGKPRKRRVCEIQITAVGEKSILAKCLLHGEGEMTWTLAHRRWRKVAQVTA